jgi:hypothetical protein
MNVFEQLITKQIEDLYDLNEQDVEKFSHLNDDGELIVDEENIIVFRIYRLNALFDHFEVALKNEPPIKMIKFIDILITFINHKREQLGDSDMEILEKEGFLYIAMRMKLKFDELTNDDQW